MTTTPESHHGASRLIVCTRCGKPDDYETEVGLVELQDDGQLYHAGCWAAR